MRDGIYVQVMVGGCRGISESSQAGLDAGLSALAVGPLLWGLSVHTRKVKPSSPSCKNDLRSAGNSGVGRAGYRA